ncbi:MAG: hypothetical protein IT385_14010 [Deltaproteobacteria bacterium]|nr:hypothetical protein [Deltaproteobacteria bacterium]
MSEPDPLLEATRRAFETLRASLSDALWDDEAARIAHARTLALVGRLDEATVTLARGGLPSAIALVHLLGAHGELEAAIAQGRRAIERFPAHAPGFRNSVASMLSALDRHADALALIEDNLAEEPGVEAWHELRALLVERLQGDGEEVA